MREGLPTNYDRIIATTTSSLYDFYNFCTNGNNNSVYFWQIKKNNMNLWPAYCPNKKLLRPNSTLLATLLAQNFPCNEVTPHRGKGKQCTFPFNFHSHNKDLKDWVGCALDNRNGRKWCYTSNNCVTDKNSCDWGECPAKCGIFTY